MAQMLLGAPVLIGTGPTGGEAHAASRVATNRKFGTDRARPKRVAKPREAGCGPAINYFFLVSPLASASAASLAVGTVPPAAWVMLISDSLLPTNTSSMIP